MNGIVKAGIAPVRASASHTAERVDEVLHGWQVEILSKNNAFFHIRTDYGYEGFVLADHIELTSRMPCHNQLVVTSLLADVVSEPTVRANVLKTLPKGSFVTPIKTIDNYTSILLPDASAAFVRTDFLSRKAKHIAINPKEMQAHEAELRESIVQNAKSYLGTQYRWGGKTSLGIDCSGLTFMAYRLCGIDIWRDAHYKEGFAIRKIDAHLAKQGDLVFYPGHVAMIFSCTKIIHSSNVSNGVTIDNLNSNFIYFGSIF